MSDRILWKSLVATGQAPKDQYTGDAGCDLYTSEETWIQPGTFVDVPCGIAVAFPEGIWGRITGRSSTIRKKGLLVIEGIIDNGYTGPIFAGVWNLTDRPVLVKVGERLAQLIPMRLVPVEFVEVDELPETERGSRGFGSSGS